MAAPTFPGVDIQKSCELKGGAKKLKFFSTAFLFELHIAAVDFAVHMCYNVNNAKCAMPENNFYGGPFQWMRD